MEFAGFGRALGEHAFVHLVEFVGPAEFGRELVGRG